jgi:DNA invertase Pin-like site-specific DNA recombinase
MLIGYARVSTNDQTLNLQLDSLKAASCTRIFTDHISGTKAERPGLAQAMSHLRAGDTLVVWRLDRLGRSLRHLIDTITALEARGIGFRSLQENIDITSPGGKLIFHIFGSLTEFEWGVDAQTMISVRQKGESDDCGPGSAEGESREAEASGSSHAPSTRNHQ